MKPSSPRIDTFQGQKSSTLFYRTPFLHVCDPHMSFSYSKGTVSLVPQMFVKSCQLFLCPLWLIIFLCLLSSLLMLLLVQVAHFVTPFCFDNLEPLHASLNGILPPDIRIREIAPVHPDFHARHSACRKTYQYKAVVAPVMEPFRHNYAYHIRHRLNIAAMQEAASYFVGVHNFSAFANASSDSTVRSVVRELLRFSVVYTVCTSAI